ncbi:MAG: MBL fold metallo-hydrolase [Bacteroidetes bacterium]|nr:MBL fold metallo-hydrolase [Bacteroidota bacterium]
MKISFHGAARCVTGSKHLIELDNGKKLLLDCGMFQGQPKEADQLNREWGFDPAQIDYLILSHAHIDHCGLIPKLVNDGYKGQIFCTPSTLDLTRILLYDSARIQEGDVFFLNKKLAKQKKPLVSALYTETDVDVALERFVPVPYHTAYNVADNIELTYTDAGHIIGSAAVNLRLKRKNGDIVRLSFSGDVGRYGDDIIRSPEVFPQADYILCESTYGDKLHEPSQLSAQKLLEVIVDTCLRKKGNLVIPAFSVGRTQELIYALNRMDIAKVLPPLDFFIDSPLSLEATQVTKDHPECYNEELLEFMKTDPQPFDFKNLHYVKDVEESKAIAEHKAPCVIIAASGMADAGRVKHHIAHNISDQRNTILMVGYCEPRSLGARLLSGVREVTVFGDPYRVEAEIKEIRSFSAHGDYEDLCTFLGCQETGQIKKLFLVHGEYDVQQVFRSKLLKKGFSQIEIPAPHQTYPL